MLTKILRTLNVIQKRPYFAIHFEKGQPQVLRGKPPQRFILDSTDIAREIRLKQGLIMALDKGRGIQLVFSKDIPEFHHQRFNNSWHNCR